MPFAKAFLFYLVLGLFFEAPALFAANGPPPFYTLISASMNTNYSSSAADTVAGATYTRSFANPASLKVELGFLPMKFLYLGFVYDLWKAGRTYDDGSGEVSDTLSYQVVGVELGYITGNPRAFFILSGFLGYPLKLSVASSTGNTYLPESAAPLAYGGRAMVGLRFVSFFALLLEGGYRLRNLGAFSDGGTPFLSGDFNLSGFYISTGAAFTL